MHMQALVIIGRYLVTPTYFSSCRSQTENENGWCGGMSRIVVASVRGWGDTLQKLGSYVLSKENDDLMM